MKRPPTKKKKKGKKKQKAEEAGWIIGKLLTILQQQATISPKAAQ